MKPKFGNSDRLRALHVINLPVLNRRNLLSLLEIGLMIEVWSENPDKWPDCLLAGQENSALQDFVATFSCLLYSMNIYS